MGLVTGNQRRQIVSNTAADRPRRVQSLLHAPIWLDVLATEGLLKCQLTSRNWIELAGVGANPRFVLSLSMVRREILRRGN